MTTGSPGSSTWGLRQLSRVSVPGLALQPGQERVTQGEYNSVALQQLDELWSRYGRLAEIWFDVSAKALSAKRVASRR